ncbi:LOW QUALITY PROTEIN: uncharacterized protein ACR2FA_002283 [Aphomia sociella]
MPDCASITILYQYKALKELKENLNDNEVPILMDFSENYSTKYSEEIQVSSKYIRLRAKYRCPLGLPHGAGKLIMKRLSCFCEECQHFNLGVLNYQVTKLHVEDVYTDSKSEDETRPAYNSPVSNIITETEISQPCVNLNWALQYSQYQYYIENTAGPSTISQQQYISGDYVLVKFKVKNTEYRYAAVINQVDNEEGELTVTFMKICDNKGHMFRMDENDISDISFNQILEKLLSPLPAPGPARLNPCLQLAAAATRAKSQYAHTCTGRRSRPHLTPHRTFNKGLRLNSPWTEHLSRDDSGLVKRA